MFLGDMISLFKNNNEAVWETDHIVMNFFRRMAPTSMDCLWRVQGGTKNEKCAFISQFVLFVLVVSKST